MDQQPILTHHAATRMAQRGIGMFQIQMAIRYGKKIYRQGYVFHVMRDKDIPDSVNAKQRSTLKRLVVVTSGGKDNAVITVYRASGALKAIRQKSKRLL